MVELFAGGFGNLNQQAGFTGRSRGTGQNRSETLIESLRAAAETLLPAGPDEASKDKADEFLKDLEESVQVAGSLKDALESQKDSERGQKISRLKERIEQLKERLKYATPEQARALAQELKRLGKEFKLAAASLSDGGSAPQSAGTASLAQLPAAVPVEGNSTSIAMASAAIDAGTNTGETTSTMALQLATAVPAGDETGPSDSAGEKTAAGAQDNGQAAGSSSSKTDDEGSPTDHKVFGDAINAYTMAIVSAQSHSHYDGNAAKKGHYEELRKIEQDLKTIAKQIEALAERDDKEAKKELKAAEKELRKGSEKLGAFQLQQLSVTDAAKALQNPMAVSGATTAPNPVAATAGSLIVNVSIDAGANLNLSISQISVSANVVA